KPPAPIALHPLALHDALPILANPRLSEKFGLVRLWLPCPPRNHTVSPGPRGTSRGRPAACRHRRPRPPRGRPTRRRCVPPHAERSEEHTSELQSRENLVCRLL